MENNMFLARLSKDGIANSKYWYTVEYATETDGLKLPNCTTYAMGRSGEVAGNSVKQGYCEDPMLTRQGYGNAKDFYKSARWAVGTVPKVGAVCCWGSDSDQYGHVAIVEEVIDDENVIVSQSNYGGTFFETKTYNCKVGKVTNGVGYVFQGYIYNPFIADIRTERNRSKFQVKVKADLLKARTEDGKWLDGLYIPKGIYNVISSFERDGYRWVKVADDVIFALNDEDGWTETYEFKEDPKDTEFDKVFDSIKQMIEEKDNRISALEGKLDSIKKILED